MIPVYQSIVDAKLGDCERAALCSLLEIDPKDVPNFSEPENSNPDCFSKVLFDHGYQRVMQLEHSSERYNKSFKSLWEYEGIKGCFYGTVYSPRFYSKENPLCHAVVIDHNFNIVHDPNPNNAGLKSYPCADELGNNGILLINVIQKIGVMKRLQGLQAKPK